MTLLELQTAIAEVINADETLAKGGCKAFAEDSLTIENDVMTHLQEVNGVAIVVITPDVRRCGDRAGELPVKTDALETVCTEIPASNRLAAGHLTALAAAQRVAALLDGRQIRFMSMRQSPDPAAGALSATAVFATAFSLDGISRNNNNGD